MSKKKEYLEITAFFNAKCLKPEEFDGDSHYFEEKLDLNKYGGEDVTISFEKGSVVIDAAGIRIRAPKRIVNIDFKF